MRRVKSTFETVPSEGGGRLGDVESLLGSGDVVVAVVVVIVVVGSVVGRGLGRIDSCSRRQRQGMHH
jgi:hypothetical protein